MRILMLAGDLLFIKVDIHMEITHETCYWSGHVCAGTMWFNDSAARKKEYDGATRNRKNDDSA